jgi:hypothetical protein
MYFAGQRDRVLGEIVFLSWSMEGWKPKRETTQGLPYPNILIGVIAI